LFFSIKVDYLDFHPIISIVSIAMSVNFEEIKENQKYQVEVAGQTFEVEGSRILSAACPRCGGSGQISVVSAEPKVCGLCGGMGMFDYSQVSSITPV
jgi:DnaJ-class molecular chaperone